MLRALAPVVVTKVLMECSPVVPVVTLAVPTGTLAIAGAPLLLLLLLISEITETAERRILVHISTEVAKRSILMYIFIEAKILLLLEIGEMSSVVCSSSHVPVDSGLSS